MRYPKQNTVACLESKDLAPAKIWAASATVPHIKHGETEHAGLNDKNHNH